MVPWCLYAVFNQVITLKEQLRLPSEKRHEEARLVQKYLYDYVGTVLVDRETVSAL